jgi:hypothetical protein
MSALSDRNSDWPLSSDQEKLHESLQKTSEVHGNTLKIQADSAPPWQPQEQAQQSDLRFSSRDCEISKPREASKLDRARGAVPFAGMRQPKANSPTGARKFGIAGIPDDLR